MSMDEVFAFLNSISNFAGKVTHFCFPVGEAPQLPYVCYEENRSNNINADNKVYKERTSYDINLCEDYRDRTVEEALENALNAAEIPWERYPEYIEKEHMWIITYEVEV